MGKHKEKSKKHKSEKRKKEKRKSKRRSSSSSNSEDEWVEKKEQKVQDSNLEREEWLSLPTNFSSSSNLDRRKEREEKKRMDKINDAYKPNENVRELNPYWKNGGDGLPTFKRPMDGKESKSQSKQSLGRWKKQVEQKQDIEELRPVELSPKENFKCVQDSQIVLSENELNLLASKLVKAEIMGNTALINELKEKLENARHKHKPTSTVNEQIVLTHTDSKGYSKPVKSQEERGEYSGGQKKKQKMETHNNGERLRYFADDDNYSLKEMFENEKFNSIEEQNKQFINLAGKVRKNDDLDDVFADDIRKTESDDKMERRNRDKAINEHRKMSASLDNCHKCIQANMPKHLIISMHETVYLCLPPFEPITDGHCLIVPIRHVPCATQLDENEWFELLELRKTLTKMFATEDKDVVFFENARNLNKHPHMSLECVPVSREHGDLAPIYFKKAIDECEREWSSNKKLINLAGKDVRRAVPKGLAYFSVSFGMQEGYAHVIEDQQYFPDNFAQEIIGGMLDLSHHKWRKPKMQNFEAQSKRVVSFSGEWNKFEKLNKL